jgi:hypothetical protein
MVLTHPSRIRQAAKLFLDGASNVLEARDRAIVVERSGTELQVLMSGEVGDPEFELTKIFKFYYTDRAGNPELSLATARLIAETYGGSLDAIRERDTVTVRLTLPLGDQ